MPRFFIDTDDGRFQAQDDEGWVMADANVARDMALAALPEMAMDKRPGSDRREFAVRVRDEYGATVYTATLSLVGEWHIAAAAAAQR